MIDINLFVHLKERSRTDLSVGVSQSTDSSSSIQGTVSGHIRNVIGCGDVQDVSYSVRDLFSRMMNGHMSATLQNIRPLYTSKATSYVGAMYENQDARFFSSYTNTVVGQITGIQSPCKNHTLEYSFSHRQQIPTYTRLKYNTKETAASKSVLHEALIPSNKSSIKYNYRWDSRKQLTKSYKSNILDNILDNTVLQSSAEIAGLPGSDVQFTKFETNILRSIPQVQNLVANVTLRNGYIYPFGNCKTFTKIPIADRFVPNATLVRGYSPFSIGPKDGRDILGGDCYYGLGISITSPLPYITTTIQPHIFYDTGNILNTHSVNSTNTIVDNSSNNCRKSSIGIGFIIPTFLGKFEVNYVSAIRDRFSFSKPHVSFTCSFDP